MLAGIDVQQHPAHRPALSLAPVRAAFARLDHQSRSLQQHLDTGVAIVDAVLLAELFVKVPYAEIEILLAVQAQHLLDHRPRHALRAGPTLATVVQPVKTKPAVALIEPPQVARTDARYMRRLPESDLLAEGP